MRADDALTKLLRDYEFETVLDYGCGPAGKEPHKQAFLDAGKAWRGFDLDGYHFPEQEIGLPCPVDCLWASHVLEHTHAPIKQLIQWRKNWIRKGGILAVTVPPLKHEIVSGHLNLYNAGLLLYQLVIAGFDCSEAAVKTYGYNISVIVRRPTKDIQLPRLKHDYPDMDTLSSLFPKGARGHNFNGSIAELNW